MSTGRQRGVGEEWKALVPVEQVLQELRFNVSKPNSNGWVATYCPFHQDQNPSLHVATREVVTGEGTSQPGHWRCAGCGKAGDIVKLVASQTGKRRKEVRKELIERFAPQFASVGASDRPKPRSRGTTITNDDVDVWVKNLGETPVILESYLWDQRRINKPTVDAARLGMFNWFVKLPVYDFSGENLMNVRTHACTRQHLEAGKPKMVGLPRKGTHLYPLWMVDKSSRRRVFCEGELDCLCLHSLGENDALTSTGGINTYKWDLIEAATPTGPGSVVVLCFDNDASGKKACAPKALPAELLARGVETVVIVTIPEKFGKDVCDWAVKWDSEELSMAWEMLLNDARVITSDSNRAAGLISVNGCLIDENSIENEVAPFIGRLSATGLRRVFGQSRHETRSFTFELEHRSGQKLEVFHQQGSKLIDSIMASPDAGGEWAFESKNDDRVLVWLSREGAAAARRKDSGFFLGFDRAEQPETFRFYSPTTIIDKDGPRRNDIVEMRAPDSWSARFDLPIPDPEITRQAVNLLLYHFLPCHRSKFTYPLLAAAFLAPVRELITRNEPRFNVLVHGESGGGKTSRSRVLQALFGSFPTDNDLLSWDSTIKAVAHLTAQVGDVFVVADELRLPELSRQEQTEALRFLQGSSQGIGRGRMTSQGDVLLPPQPKSILAVTLETLPMESQSQLARALILHVPRVALLGDELQQHYETLLGNAGCLPHAMSSWISWILSAPEASGKLLEAEAWSKSAAEKVISDVQPRWRSMSNAARVYSRLASVGTAFHLWLSFAYQITDVGTQRIEQLRSEWEKDVLPVIFSESLESLVETSTHGLFLAHVVAALQSGSCALKTWMAGPAAYVPDYQSPNSKIIGFISQADAADENSSIWRGHRVRVGLTATAVSAIRGSERGLTWNHVKQYMRNNETATRETGRLGNQRALWLSKESAKTVLDPFQ